MPRFELTEGKSKKFWEVRVEKSTLTVRFGRIGTDGQVKTKKLPSSAAAAKEAEKLVRQKVGKGYRQVKATKKETATKETKASSTRARTPSGSPTTTPATSRSRVTSSRRHA